MSKKKSFPEKVATVALWMVAIPALLVVQAVRGKKDPKVSNRTPR